ncbi:hypothetical protein M1E17_10925 [Arthrobacter sp. D1-29]
MSVQPPNNQPQIPSSLRARLAPPVRLLAAGPWSARLVGDELAHLSYAGRPVLRAVKAVVRDQDWRTPQPSVATVNVTQGDDGLHARWTVKYAGYGVEYDGVLMATFTPAAVEITFEGTAAHAFCRNRIGLVVLHPPADAGRDVAVEHTGGDITAAQFPRDISPHQPFMDIAALEWADAGTSFRLSFTGDIFETEDQRNWTDASFKTYCTPLELPFPVDVAAGDTVRQSVLLEAATFEPQEAVEIAAAGTLRGVPDDFRRFRASVGGIVGQVPALAVVAGQSPEILAPIPGLDALVVELVEQHGDAPRSGWGAELEAAAAAAALHPAALDIRAVTPDPVGAVADLAPYLPDAKRLAVFHPGSHLTEPDGWQEVRAAAQTAGFRGGLLAGVRSHFTELNRNSGRTPSDSDALTFSITPQMHSTETAHIIDSVPVHRLVARNALRLGGGRPLHVGPVTLLPRFNAVATSGDGGEAEADELQTHPFTAAWTLASIGALTMDGVACISYFEASGPRGICDHEGRLNPAGELLKELAALRGNPVLAVDVPAAPPTADTAVTLYAVQSPGGLMIFAANLSGAAAEIDLQLPGSVTAGASECTAFGPGAGSVITFDIQDDGPPRGLLTLGPWSAGVVRFPAPS